MAHPPESALVPLPDFRALFESAPGLYLVLATDLTILAVSNAYLRATMTRREQIVGRFFFDIFADNPNNSTATGLQNLRASLQRVLQHRVADAMTIQEYDIRRPASEGGGFEERFWSPVNSPVLGANGEVTYIIHHVEDVTEFIHLRQREVEQTERAEELSARGQQMESELFLQTQQLLDANQKLREANEELNRIRAELEDRVEDRTSQLRQASDTLRAKVNELERTDKQLIKTAEKLRVTLESIGDAVIVTDAEGQITLLNPVAEWLTGWSAADAIGSPLAKVFQIVSALTRETAENPINRVLAEGVIVGLANHTLLIARDGRERPIDDSAAPIRDATGNVLGVVLIFRDVTERYAAEETLRRERTLLRTIIDSIPDLIFTKDTAGRFDLCNQSLTEFTGLPAPSITGKTVFDLFPPEQARAFHEDDLRVLTRGETVINREELARDAGGRDSWRLVTKAPLRDHNGNVVGLVGVSRNIQERKESEQSLQASEALFRGAFEDTNVAMVVTNMENRFLRVNTAFARLFGYAPEEMVGMAVADITHPDDLPASYALRQKLLAGEPFFVQHKRYRHRDGRTLWGVTNISLVRDTHGRPFQYVGQVQDISDQKRVESELRTSEGKFQALFDSTTAAIGELSPDGRILLANAGFCRMYGYSPEELPGLSLTDIIHPEDAEALRVQYGRIGRGEITSYEVDRRYKRKDGSTLWGRASLVAVPDEAGKPKLITAVVIDLTDRKAAEDALRASEERFRLLVESVRDYAIFMIDPEEFVTMWNPGAERLYGYSVAEAIGLPLSRFHTPEDIQAGMPRRRIARAAEVGTHQSDGWRVRKDGTRFWAEVVTTALRYGSSRSGLRGFVVVARDLTDRRRLEEQFRQSQKLEAVGRLAGGVAHDFNNLLTVINGYADLLLSFFPPDSPHREPLSAIHDAGERAAALTSQLLAFSRKAIVESKILDLNEVIDQSTRLLRRLVGEDVILTASLTNGLHHIKADPTQIEQIILNLAVNARDAMPTGGRLTIETRNFTLRESESTHYPDLQPGRYVQLAVSDTGCGMSDAVKGRIFEPFFTTKGQGKGTGLGLSMVYGAVKTHGGNISVYSEVGVGTTFKILLPATSESPSGSWTGEVRLAPRGTETVLVAEDEESVRRFTKLTLETHGYTVLEGANGGDALIKAEAHPGPIHLLITDVVMPGMGGRALAESLKELHPELEVLYVSGYTDDAVVRHGIVEATDAFLQKPFSPLALVRKVRAILDGNNN